ncbi:MAG TPA: hypothetical protein VF064_02265 [Pyrinomonadaceae bacterium]
MKRTIAVLALLVSLCAPVPAQDKDKTGKIRIEADQNYPVLSTKRIQTMEKELNEAAREGYRLLPRTIVYKEGFFTAEMVMVMERAPRSNKSYEYKLVRATKETSLHRKIDEAGAQGFAPITMVIIGEHVIITEKETEQKAGR